MDRSAVEHGTLWAFETGDGLPEPCAARVETSFGEADDAELDDLAAAMGLPTPEPIRERLQEKRRCFILKTNDQIATYGWVTHGPEYVGEIERRFNLQHNEAYIWDCATVPAWRGQRCYSALLSHLIYQLHDERVSRIWIGASRQNRPSVRGFVNAGFLPVLDLIYRRIYRLTFVWITLAQHVTPSLAAAGYRILLDENERRFGPLAIGYKRPTIGEHPVINPTLASGP